MSSNPVDEASSQEEPNHHLSTQSDLNNTQSEKR